MNTTSSLLSGLKRRLWIIALFGAVGAVVAAIPQPQNVEEQATTFNATHTMLINDTAGLSSSVGVSPNQVVLLATTGEVPEEVADEIGFSGNPAALSSQVSVSFDQASGALTFSTSSDMAAEAELIADTFAEVTNAYLIDRQTDVYNQRVQASRDRLAGLEAELDNLTAELAFDPENPILLGQRDAISRQYSLAFEQDRAISSTPSFLSFTTLQRAQAVPVVDRGLSTPTGRRTRAIMGLIAGLAVGTAVALLLARADRKIRSREQAEEALGMRARVEVPVVKQHGAQAGIVVVNGRHDVLSDSYRTLRNVVTFVQSGSKALDRAHVTVVVSPGQGDGKTSLAANLAAAFVESGRRTIAVNTDFRRPRLAYAINGESPAELPYTFEELELLDPKLMLTRTDHTNLLMMDLSSIDATPGELVRSTVARFPTLVGMADELVIDTSPVGITAEPLELVPFADVIVMVIRLGHTSLEEAEETLTRLRDVSIAPVILALTGAKPHKGKYVEYGEDRASNAWPWPSPRVKREAPQTRESELSSS
jgi:Mrp family chromosome partitioning ATPase